MFVTGIIEFAAGGGFALFGGGRLGALVSGSVSTATTNKYTYATSVVVPGSSLGLARNGLAATGSATFGLFSGGAETTNVTITGYTDKYVFASGAVTVGTVLLCTRNTLMAAGNGVVGIFAGGYISEQNYLEVTDKITYSGETSERGTTLTTPVTAGAATSTIAFGLVAAGSRMLYTVDTEYDQDGSVIDANHPSYAGINDGTAQLELSQTKRYVFADNTVVLGTVLSTRRFELASAGNASVGVFSGGRGTELTYLTSSEKYVYASEIVSAGTALGDASSSNRAATANSSVGIFNGGHNGISQTDTSYLYNFSSDVVSATTAIAAVQLHAGVSSAASAVGGGSTIAIPLSSRLEYALFAGGWTGAINTSRTDKYMLGTEAVSTGTSLQCARRQCSGVGNYTVGVYAGGYYGNFEQSCENTIDWSSEAFSSGGNLARKVRDYGTATSPTAGWFFSGAVGTTTAGMGGVVHTSVQAGSSTLAVTWEYRYASRASVNSSYSTGETNALMAGAGTAEVGYFGGGSFSGYKTSVKKVTYATNTVSAGTALGTARAYLGAAGNETRGIYAGGSNGSSLSSTEKYTYAGDVRVAGGALSATAYWNSGTGNATYGLFHNGWNPSLGVESARVFKYLYSTDTASTGTALGVARYASAAASSSPGGFIDQVPPAASIYVPPTVEGYAVITGGYAGVSDLTATDKYTYNTDTITVGTAIGVARSFSSGASNATLGVLAGGFNGLYQSATDKYTWVGETVVAGTSLPTATSYQAATSTTTFGLWGGGGTGSGLTTATYKYTFSGDSVVSGTALGTSRDALAAAGNATVGYFAGGGIVGGAGSTAVVDTYTYAGDIRAAGTSLLSNKWGLGGVGNTTSAFFAGGEGKYFGVNGFYYSVDEYLYASGVRINGANLMLSPGRTIGTSNPTFGLYHFGWVGGYSNITMKRFFSHRGTYTGATLAVSRFGTGAASSVPGGF